MNYKITSCLLFLVLLFSVGYNLFLIQRISIMKEFIVATNPWVSEKEYDLIKKEIDRLSQENIKYDVKTRQPIKNLGE